MTTGRFRLICYDFPCHPDATRKSLVNINKAVHTFSRTQSRKSGKGVGMATKYAASTVAGRGKSVAGFGGTKSCDDLLTLEERETLAVKAECISCSELQCAPFILPKTRISKAWNGRKTALAEIAVYAVIVTTVIYSVVVDSLPALMFAIILTGSYVVLSHFYQEAVEARNEIEAKNYMNLISPTIGKN